MGKTYTRHNEFNFKKPKKQKKKKDTFEKTAKEYVVYKGKFKESAGARNDVY